MAPTASRSPAHLWVKASPRGTRSGFAVLPDGAGGQVTITVVPKPWAPRAGGTHGYAHRPGTTTHIVMHEMEVAGVTSTGSAVGTLAISLAEIASDQADLLALAAPPEDPAFAPAVSGDPFRSLIDLLLLAERGRLTASRLSFEGAYAPSLVRLVAHELLLRAVESVLFRARPRYSEQSEILDMPRGRLSERSLLFSMVTGTPRVESHFDELSIDTPLLQVVASALRVVASERLPRKVAVLRPGLQSRATQLLRHLSGVRLLDRERALLTAERLWIGQLDRIWAPAIDAAVPVLRNREVTPEDGGADTQALLVRVSTEKFWEQCLELALQNAFGMIAVGRDAQPGTGVKVPAPWVPRGAPTDGTADPGGFPDFMFRSSRRVVIADAKYKLHRGTAPSSQDGYQLFAYSHLASLGGQTSDLALILYPSRSGGRPRQLELERLPDRAFPLWLLSLPFPGPADLATSGNWGAYVARLTRTIRDFSLDWLVRRNENGPAEMPSGTPSPEAEAPPARAAP